MKREEASVIIKARLELLNLGYVPNRRNEEECTSCGERVREDTVHFHRKCKKLEV